MRTAWHQSACEKITRYGNNPETWIKRMRSAPLKSYNTTYIFLPTHVWKELWRGNGGVKIEWFRAACPKTTALHFIYGPTGNASLDFDQWDWKTEQVLEMLKPGDARFFFAKEKMGNMSGRRRHLVAVHISCPVASLSFLSGHWALWRKKYKIQ